MNIRWLWLDFIDPQLPLTREQKRSVRRHARLLREMDEFAQYAATVDVAAGVPTTFKMPSVWRFFGPIIAFCLISMFITLSRNGWRGAGIFLAFVAIIVVWTLGSFLMRNRFRWPTYLALRLHGFDVCRECGYWLRGLDNNVARCPECGGKRDAMPETSS